MEVIKRKISLEDSTDRGYNSPTWGVMTASSFNLKVLLTQNVDDMGLFTDIEYIPLTIYGGSAPDYSVLIDKLNASGYTFSFMSGGTSPIMTGITGTTKVVLRLPVNVDSDYFNFGNLRITGSTDSKIEDVRSYDSLIPFKIGFDMAKEGYVNYLGTSVSGVTRVKSIGEPKIYVFDTLANASLGTNNQVYGLQYLDFTGTSRQVTIDNISTYIPVTNFKYIGEGWNQTNISLSALTKEEYLFGIISKPEVQSDVFIDRGITTVMDKHLRLSEINNLGHLIRYGNGFYNLTTQ